jgi:hypothetical protein
MPLDLDAVSNPEHSLRYLDRRYTGLGEEFHDFADFLLGHFPLLSSGFFLHEWI